MSATPPARPAFDLKSTSWTLTALRLQTADPGAVGAALDSRFADSPGLFDNEPVVIDLSPLCAADEAVDFDALLAHLQRHGMRPIAAQGGSAAQMAAAAEAGLAEAQSAAWRPEASVAPDPATAAAEVREVEVVREVMIEVPAASRAPTLVVDKPLRSGQRVYARGGDLVVLAVVSFGAEVIADGSIHVYAPLRGRAIAGARGDIGARIFSSCMEPQLVSIAGIYRTTETPLPDAVVGKLAQVRLAGEKIIVEPLGA
jgi:septum site-determining protein MinC